MGESRLRTKMDLGWSCGATTADKASAGHTLSTPRPPRRCRRGRPLQTWEYIFKQLRGTDWEAHAHDRCDWRAWQKESVERLWQKRVFATRD